MKGNVYLILIINFLITPVILNAQNNTIEGIVIDDFDKPIEFVNVLLLKKSDSSFVRGTVTDLLGKYLIEDIKSGQYILQFSHISYDNKEFSIEFKNEEKLKRNTKLTFNALDEVLVVIKKQAIKVDTNKIIFDVKASNLSEGSTALEIIREIPTVIVDNEDNISLAGKDKVSVVINGKLMNLSNEDLIKVLNSISGNNIDKIEVLNNPSSKYDATSGAGLININLRKNFESGFSSSINSSWSYGRRPKFNSGLNINYGNKSINFWGIYVYSDNKFTEDLALDRFILDGTESWVFNQKVENNQQFVAHSLTTGLELEIFEDHFIDASFEYQKSDDLYQPRGNTIVTIDNVIDSSFDSNNDQDLDWNQHVYSIGYRGKLNEKSNLSSAYNHVTNNEFSDALTQQDIDNNLSTQNIVSSKINLNTFK